MIAIAYPKGVNWFYERLAQRVIEDLARVNVAAKAISPSALLQGNFTADCVLIISLGEILASLPDGAAVTTARQQLERCRHRFLLNYDSVATPWFTKHLVFGPDFFSGGMLDIGLIPQTEADRVLGIPYRWLAEAFTERERATLSARTGPRPIPWAMIAHQNKDRAAFVAAVIQNLPRNGFVYAPKLRPFYAQSGLGEEGVDRVLARTHFYLWGSHHQHRYHEGLRALQAVRCGAVPAKIDPLHARTFDLPWVYSSLVAFRESAAFADPDTAFEAARDRLLANGTLGQGVKRALTQADVSLSVH